MRRLLIFVSLVVLGCSDSSIHNSKGLDAFVPRTILNNDADIDQGVDLNFIDYSLPDAYVDPCLNVTSSSENFCDCHPQC